MYSSQKSMSSILIRISVSYTMVDMVRRKPKSERKDESILVRATTDQKATLTAAAKRAGLDLSSWLRSLGLREAALESVEKDARK